MDHLCIYQQHKEQQLSGQGTSKRGAVVKMTGRASRGSTELIYSHMRRRGGKEWTEGWLGMPEEEEKKYIYNSRAAVF